MNEIFCKKQQTRSIKRNATGYQTPADLLNPDRLLGEEKLLCRTKAQSPSLSATPNTPVGLELSTGAGELSEYLPPPAQHSWLYGSRDDGGRVTGTVIRLLQFSSPAFVSFLLTGPLPRTSHAFKLHPHAAPRHPAAARLG
ncbi:hypothetical protein E2C01_043216 [Portunus trituberculatus]|uniref:Uncharacterized protein n=1 Tax=Portunus trituberculatus TaxID=210409 RepID=A0A5B7FVH8_PORTR|nr:hypothetical protein [Portunus trituberculatus]